MGADVGGATDEASSDHAGMAGSFMARVRRLAEDAVELGALVNRLEAAADPAPLGREDAEDATQSVLATATDPAPTGGTRPRGIHRGPRPCQGASVSPVWTGETASLRGVTGA
ncbi:hypothetical protein GCM10010232_29880 [Streptomyces amakusaensis]